MVPGRVVRDDDWAGPEYENCDEGFFVCGDTPDKG
jgi:hypothetical protein